MADPLSITTGVLALLGSSIKIVQAIKDFHDGAATADLKVNGLLSEVRSFTQVLNMMKDTLEDEKVRESMYATGHIGNHWNNISTTIKDGQNTLLQLQDTLDKTNKSVSIFDGARKHIRLKDASQKILVFQQQIQSYRDTIQLSLQAVILWNQVSFKESTEKILPNLDQLHESIRRLAFDINARMVALQTPVESKTKDEQMQNLSNLRNCVQSAASVVSSASTTLGVDHTNRFSVIYGSDFGDCLPPKPSETILRWVSSDTVYEFEEDIPPDLAFQDRSGVSGKKNKQSSENNSLNHSDSDDELEVEIVQALLKQGKEKLDAEDFRGAESMLRNCHSRTTSSGSISSPSRDLTPEVLTLLLKTYEQQGKWTDAQALLIEKIALGSRNVAGDNNDVLLDILHLVKVLLKKKSYSEALLYGRRALKGYRRMGDSGTDGVYESLQWLVTICHEAGNIHEEKAYTAVLSGFKDQQALQTNEKPLSASLENAHIDPMIPSLPDLGEPSISSETHGLVQQVLVQPSTPELNSSSWEDPQKLNLTLHIIKATSSDSVAFIPDGQSNETSRETSDNVNDKTVIDFSSKKGSHLDEKMQASSAQRSQDDETYFKLYEELSEDLKRLQVTLRDYEIYIRSTGICVKEFLHYASSIELTMRLSASPYPELERKWVLFNVSMRSLGNAALEDYVTAVDRQVIEPIKEVIDVYVNTGLGTNDHAKGHRVSAINERAKLRLDYEKYLLAKAAGKRIDKKLSKLVLQYLAVNRALIAELPKLRDGSREIMKICFIQFLFIQKEWYSKWQDKVQAVLEEAQLPKDVSDIVSVFNRDHKSIQETVEKLRLANGTVSDGSATEVAIEAPSPSTTKDTKLALLNDIPLSDSTFSGLFQSAMPLSNVSDDGEHSSKPAPTNSLSDCSEDGEQSSTLSLRDRVIHVYITQSRDVLYMAASLFEWRFSEATKIKQVAGYPFLEYDAGEIFDVYGDKGELWLATNQDDSEKTVGWIWSKHFARFGE